MINLILKIQLLQRVDMVELIFDQAPFVRHHHRLIPFVTAKANGFGLNISLPAPQTPGAVLPVANQAPNQDPNQAPNQVKGQQLQKVEQTPTDAAPDNQLYWVLLVCLLLMFFGAVRQYRSGGMIPSA